MLLYSQIQVYSFFFSFFFYFYNFYSKLKRIPSFFLLYEWKTSTMYTFTISVLKLYTIYYVIICMKLLCDVDTVTCTPSLISIVIEKQRHCLHCIYHAKYRQLHTYFLLSLGYTSTKIIQLLLKFIISAIVHSLWL